MKIYRSKKLIPISTEKEWNYKVDGAFKDCGDFHVGGNSLVCKKGRLDKYFPRLAQMYPNLDVTIKIVLRGQRMHDKDALIAKNIGWLNGVGPKVYREVVVKNVEGEEKYKAYIVEYVDGKYSKNTDEATKLWFNVKNKLESQGIAPRENDPYSSNFRGNKLIDYEEYRFINKDKYKEELYKRYKRIAYWGNSSAPYQNIPSLGIFGSRTQDRFKLLDMEKLNLTGKTVLDIGCSGGQGLVWAYKHGADRIVGLDTPEIAKVTFEMMNFHRMFPIETIGCNLTDNDEVIRKVKSLTGIGKFDYVIMFSVNAHVGFHQYMRDFCKDTLFLECNAAKMPAEEVIEYPRELRKLGYSHFEYKGQVNESGGRSLFICQ